jgi:quercetin dioxygenase-like cupin family protein
MSAAPSDPIAMPATAMATVIDPINVDSLDTFTLTSSTSDDAAWVRQFFAYGGAGADRSTAICFAMPPGKRLGRHTDTAEETQYILSGAGALAVTGTPNN